MWWKKCVCVCVCVCAVRRKHWIRSVCAVRSIHQQRLHHKDVELLMLIFKMLGCFCPSTDIRSCPLSLWFQAPFKCTLTMMMVPFFLLVFLLLNAAATIFVLGDGCCWSRFLTDPLLLIIIRCPGKNQMQCTRMRLHFTWKITDHKNQKQTEKQQIPHLYSSSTSLCHLKYTWPSTRPLVFLHKVQTLLLKSLGFLYSYLILRYSYTKNKGFYWRVWAFCTPT